MSSIFQAKYVVADSPRFASVPVRLTKIGPIFYFSALKLWMELNFQDPSRDLGDDRANYPLRSILAGVLSWVRNSATALSAAMRLAIST